MKKIILLVLAAIALGGGTLCVVAQKNSPVEVLTGAQERANLAMTHAYGANWQDRYAKCVKNRAESKAMSAIYRSALK